MKLAFYHSSSRSTRSPLSRLLSLSQIPHMFSFAYNSFRRCEPRMTRRRCSGDAANWSALTKSIAYSPNMITAKSRTLSLSLSRSLVVHRSCFQSSVSYGCSALKDTACLGSQREAAGNNIREICESYLVVESFVSLCLQTRVSIR